MRIALLFALILALTLSPAEARHRHWGLWGFFSVPHAHWHGYRHHRYARHQAHRSVAEAPSDRSPGHTYTTAELVPPNWQLQPSDPNLKGQRFVSPDGKGSLALFATPAKQQANAKHMNAVAFVDGEQITHLRGEENWIEVSGLKADQSFYRKAVLACAGQVWHEVSFEYPTESQDDITKFVIRAAKAVQDSEDQGCEASESSAADKTPNPEVPTAPSSNSND
jgi:hypothetical protein